MTPFPFCRTHQRTTSNNHNGKWVCRVGVVNDGCDDVVMLVWSADKTALLVVEKTADEWGYAAQANPSGLKYGGPHWKPGADDRLELVAGASGRVACVLLPDLTGL
jgi:hypothetical protein